MCRKTNEETWGPRDRDTKREMKTWRETEMGWKHNRRDNQRERGRQGYRGQEGALGQRGIYKYRKTETRGTEI